MVCKQPKKHGTRSVVILDDVCTKGDPPCKPSSRLRTPDAGARRHLSGGPGWQGIVPDHVFTLAELVAHKEGLHAA